MESANSTTTKLWLWKNFVDGKPEYWAFDNPFPGYLDCGDPQTLGEPCGYAIFKESRNGRPDVSEEEVLRRIAAAGRIVEQREKALLADNERLEAEVIRLQREVVNRNARALEGDKAITLRESLIDKIERLEAERDALFADNERLREALLHYGEHEGSCSIVDLDDDGYHCDCDCGFSHTLAATPAQSLVRVRNQVREDCINAIATKAVLAQDPIDVQQNCVAAIRARKEPE